MGETKQNDGSQKDGENISEGVLGKAALSQVKRKPSAAPGRQKNTCRGLI